MEYVLDSKIFEPGQIEQKLHRKNQIDVMARWVVDTRDIAIRKDLITLGWTPPGAINVECIYEVGCSAMQTGHCALSHCPKFIKRH